MADTPKRGLITIIVILALAALAVGILTMKDNRTTGERIGDAIDALPEGPGKAVDELKDKDANDRVGDAVEDLGDKVKDAGESIKEEPDNSQSE